MGDSKCKKCGIDYHSISIFERCKTTCPVYSHTGTYDQKRVWYQSSAKGSGYFSTKHEWSCCKSDNPCHVTYVNHDFDSNCCIL